MKVYSDPKTYNGNNTVVTIGMFDGVHAGHKVLLNHLTERAAEINGEATVVTFWPHPRLVLNKDVDNLQFITTLDEKTMMISQQGIDHLLLLPFSKELASMTAEEFIKCVLIDQVRMKHLVVGYNHRFGKDRVHDYAAYQKLSVKYGFGISRVEAVYSQNEIISSSAIRNHLLNGNIVEANKMLGYSFSIFGTVTGGKQLGRRMGYPTANIKPNENYKMVPSKGVYACSVHVIGKNYGGMLNVGIRPTVNDEGVESTIEVHILDFNQDIYSEEITVTFIDKVRDEIKFGGLDELKQQLMQDEVIIRKVINRTLS